MNAIQSLGGPLGRPWLEAARLLSVLARTAVWTFLPPYDFRELGRQLFRVGVASVPVIALTSAFSGMVIALQTYIGFARFGAETWVGAVVALSVTRELAPVISGLMLTGRVGSAMAAELGSMRVTEQVDALVAMGVEPVQYLFVPRVLAATLMLPLLVAIADVIGIEAGRVVAVTMLGTSPVTYDERAYRYLEAHDVLSGLAKAVVFGFLLSVIACEKGYFTTGGSAGVGRSTTRAVVMGSVAIIASDYFLTQLLF